MIIVSYVLPNLLCAFTSLFPPYAIPQAPVYNPIKKLSFVSKLILDRVVLRLTLSSVYALTSARSTCPMNPPIHQLCLLLMSSKAFNSPVNPPCCLHLYSTYVQ